MTWLKKFIIRIFKIKPDDLDENFSTLESKIYPVLSEEIKKQISKQLQELFGDLDKDAIKLLLEDKKSKKNIEDQSTKTFPDKVILNNHNGDETNISNKHGNVEIEKKQEKIYEEHFEISKFSDKHNIRIGVDFGTSTTEISLHLDNKPPEVLEIGQGNNQFLIPSTVYIKPGDGDWRQRVVVGEEAEAYADADRTVRSIKRCIGCDGYRCQNNLSLLNTWCKQDGKIHIEGEEPITPEEIGLLIIQEALSRATQIAKEKYKLDLQNEDIELVPCNIGCGAMFDNRQRNLLLSIAHKAGLKSVKIRNIIEEPILAGFTFSRFEKNPAGNILIYDFGGGTFDVAILSINDNQEITVLATDGERMLGGDDIDDLIFNYLVSEISNYFKISTESLYQKLDLTTLHGLKISAKQYKEEISIKDSIIDDLLIPELGNFQLRLTRETFEELLENSGIVQKSLECTRRACKLMYAYYHTMDQALKGELPNASNITKFTLREANKYINRVILVGGTTNIPYIKKELYKYFDKTKFSNEKIVPPILAVAIGASYQCNEENYSICFPPYELYLESAESEIRKTIFSPFEHLNFHKEYYQNAVPAYAINLDIEKEIKFPKLYLKKVDQEHPEWSCSLKNIPIGKAKFYITIEGTIFYQISEEKNIFQVKETLPTHPIQDEIRKAKERYKTQKEICEKSRRGNYEDWIRDLMNEN